MKRELALLRELQRREAEESTEYFIENFVYIEDRDSQELAIPFSLWQGQKQALGSIIKNRLNIILKARQLGITWLVLAYAVWQLVFKDGYMVVALSRGEEEAKELVRRVGFILKHLPLHWGIDYTPTASQVTINRPNGEPSVFKSFTAAADSGRSFTANLVILDEWAFQQWAREIWKAAYPTINRPTGGKLIGLSTIERGTLFEDIWQGSKKGENNFNRIFLGWDTDPRRTQAWYEQTKKDIGDDVLSEYPATEEEAFQVPGGAYFPEVKKAIHIQPVEPIMEHWYRYVCIDYGLDMLAAYWLYIDGKGHARVYRELHEPDLIVSAAVERILECNQGDRIYQYIAPPDLWNRNRDTGKSTAQLFREYGIHLSVASNDFEQGCLNMKEWLKPIAVKNEQTGDEYTTAKLTIDEGAAPELWHSLTNIQKDKRRTNVYAKEPHNLTHSVDGIRYFCASQPRIGKLAEKKSEKEYIFEFEKEGNDLALWS